jgi:MOSC domain-containing protein YiiM
MSEKAHVEAIHLCPRPGDAPTAHEAVSAVADMGLEGDRNFGRTKNGKPKPQDAATLIQAETIEAIIAEGIPLAPGETRRNITTRGVDLNALVGKRFRVGNAILEGYELCAPCFHLEKRTGKKIKSTLEGRGGLRAYVRESGTIRASDSIEVLPPTD